MRSDLDARYTIGEPSHENEFVVYPATDKRMGWPVCIVEPDLGLKSDKDRLQRAWSSINEAKALPSSRFLEILDLLAPTDFDNAFYIVEKRPGKTLRQYIEEQELIAFDRAVEVIRYMLEGLATLHGAGFAHNALTDRCIYVSEDYSGLSVRIGNLHLISRIGDTIVPPYVPEFGAPDLYRGTVFKAAAAPDVYSAGMIAYKLLMPRRTYAEVFQDVMVWDEEHQRDQNWNNIHLDETKLFPRLDTLVPGLPGPIAQLVERMLSRDPAQRPRDATEALAEFRRVTTGVGMPMSFAAQAAPAPPPTPPKPPRRWTAPKIAALAILLVLAVGVGVVTVPRLLRPDPELVASVQKLKAEVENRRKLAIAAKAPERPADDVARKDFDAGSTALKAGTGAIEQEDYNTALSSLEAAALSYGRSLTEVSLANTESSREAARQAGGEQAPVFVTAQATVTTAQASLAANDFLPALKGLKEAKAAFDALSADLGTIAAGRKAAEAKREEARRAGGEPSPDFKAASATLDAATAAAGQWKAKDAASGFEGAAKSYGALASAMTELTDARKQADQARNRAVAISGPDDPEIQKPKAAFDAAVDKAKHWEVPPATAGFDEAGQGFKAIIDGVMAAKGDAEAARKRVADLLASLVKRTGATEPTLVAAGPRIVKADGRVTAQAYKLALAEYRPILADLEKLAAQGFCPGPADGTFRTVAAGQYPLAGVRLMTSSMPELGGMLGAAGGAAKIDKPFCVGAHVVTRGEMAAFYKSDGKVDQASPGESEKAQPAADVPWPVAQRYAAWMSNRLGSPVRLPSAVEWMASAVSQPPASSSAASDDGDVALQWSATPCEGGYVAFLAQASSTFAVCSDASTGGLFRVIGDLR